MAYKFILFVMSFLLGGWSLLAQTTDTQTNRLGRLELGLEQDANFGFYPNARAVFPLNQIVEVGGYGNFYTNAVYASPDGTGPWTEFGLLVNLLPIQRQDQSLVWSINAGLSNGSILSGDSVARFAEGLAIGSTILYNYSIVELLASGSYYTPFKKRGLLSNSFYFFSVSAGVYLVPSLSLGLHYEDNQLSFPELDIREQSYEWLGPYIQLLINQTYTLRFTGGWDLADNGFDSFYKLGLSINFE